MQQTNQPRRPRPRLFAFTSVVGLGAVAAALVAAQLAAVSAERERQDAAPVLAPDAPAAQPTRVSGEGMPRIDEVLTAGHPDLRRFNEYLTILASPWMDGRLPGTAGMERAMQFVEWGFTRAGLEKPVPTADGGRSWRQPFELGTSSTFVDPMMSLRIDGTSTDFVHGTDFKFSTLGRGGDVAGELVYVGYAIDNADRGYTTFEGDVDLSGKVVMMLRFEPMTEEGRSRWAEEGWSNASAFAGKLAAVMSRKPAGVLVVQTPGADDERVKTLSLPGRGAPDASVPVVSITPATADALLKPTGRTALDLRKESDAKGFVLAVPQSSVHLSARKESTKLLAENVVGLLPGRGALKDEIIVMGGHLDHLGYGDFGSRSGPGPLHPGADDNASGSAGVMMLAEMLAEDYRTLPADASLRSILFIAFSAEESGLNGSRYYTQNPLFPARNHVLMFNYDMIGRIKNERLAVSGTGTGKGMHEWALPFYARAKEAWGLEVVASAEPDPGGSDHASFIAAGIPAIFAIIADFHDDYHTPRDVGDLINRESSVKAIWLFREMALSAAQVPERWPFEANSGPMRQQQLRVRLGVRSREADDGRGVVIVEVTPEGNAARAGFVVGDRLLKWNKQPVENREAFVRLLRQHGPGDEVQAVVEREGQETTLFVKFAE
jgi:hypothetical protein